MTGPIDEAYVEIKPDLDNFDRDVRRGLEASFDRIEDKVDDLTDLIDKQFDRLIIVLDQHFGNLQRTAEDTFDEIQKSARDAGRSIATDIDIGTKVAKHEIDDLADNAHHDFNRIQKDARGSGFSIGKMFSSLGQTVGNVFSSIGSSVSSIGSNLSSSLGSTIGQVGSSISTVTGSIGSVATIAAYAVLIPTVIGLASSLSQLIGILAALPAAAGVALAAILPLVLAFHGFSDAIGAVISGDPKKINEALKKLSPSAAKVVKEFSALVKPFSALQKIAQEALFKPLVGTLTQLANAVLPSLRAGIGPVAAAFGQMFAFIAKAFSNKEFAGVLTNTFAATARIISMFTPVLGQFFAVFVQLWSIGLPFVERFFAVIAKGIGWFSQWLETAANGGQVVGWLTAAWDVGKKLWEVLKQLSIFAITLLGAFSDEGTDTLNGMADALKKVNDYFKTSKGEETLHNLGVAIHWAGNAFNFMITSIGGASLAINGLFAFVRGIGPFFSSLGTTIHNVWDSVVDWTVGAWHSITGAVTSAWNGITGFFVTAWQSVVGFFVGAWNFIINGFRNLFTTANNTGAQFASAVRHFFVDAPRQIAFDIGVIIGSIIKWFFYLGDRVIAAGEYLRQGAINTWNNIVNFFTQTIPTLASNVGQWFVDMWNNAVNNTRILLDIVVNYVSQLPLRVWTYIVSMADRVQSGFISARDRAVAIFHQLVDQVTSTAQSLPGRVWDALKSLADQGYNIGRNMIIGMINGIKSAAGWLVDQAKSAVSNAWAGAKNVLGVRSPSKKWRETGVDSIEGYAEGWDSFDLTKHISKSVQLPMNAFSRRPPSAPMSTSVNVGGAQVVAYLQIGDDQLQPVMVRTLHDNSQDVALAAQQGNTDLARRR